MSYLALFGSQLHYHTVAAPYGQVILLWLSEQPDRRTDDAEKARQELKLDPVQFAMGLEWCQREMHVIVYDSDYDGKTTISMVDMGKLEYKSARDAFMSSPWTMADLDEDEDDKDDEDDEAAETDESASGDSSEKKRDGAFSHRPNSFGDRFPSSSRRYGSRPSFAASHRFHEDSFRQSRELSPFGRRRFGSYASRYADDEDEITITYERGDDRWLIALFGALFFMIVVLIPPMINADESLEADVTAVVVTVLVMVAAFFIGMGLTWLTLIARDRWRKNHAE